MTTPQQKIGPYQLVGEIGVGGLGKVFKGIDSRTGQTVAVKFLHDKFASNRRFLGIFHRELLIVSRLHHKHIVNYLDSGFVPPNCFIVTEFIEGWSLHTFIKKMQRVPPLVGLCIAIDMLQGIDYLHLHEIIHADLSAANVLLEKTGRVVVTDFGLACERDIEDYKNFMVGTPGYYSPEHLMEASIVPQTDIYCAGLILFELITGRKAVPALNNRNKTLEHMKNIPFDAIRCSEKAMEANLKKLLKEALAFNPAKRFQVAEAMMFECYRILKRYRIRYARHAIKKYLIDKGVSQGPYEGAPQEIYIGQAS